MGKIIKAEKRGGGGIESKVIEEYTPLIIFFAITGNQQAVSSNRHWGLSKRRTRGVQDSHRPGKRKSKLTLRTTIQLSTVEVSPSLLVNEIYHLFENESLSFAKHKKKTRHMSSPLYILI